ncbi:hypothetical protein EIP91_003554 [Steccherinum ochraceum]|uniref:Uncharacterized protein n=1 Tax=Steccherinum ochraceum TaxID=92696 RepID=A0A4R0RAB8_9APHY|nr:hypothetical protein EIP91_003554 [Steccherinum ochraceum]
MLAPTSRIISHPLVVLYLMSTVLSCSTALPIIDTPSYGWDNRLPTSVRFGDGAVDSWDPVHITPGVASRISGTVPEKRWSDTTESTMD